MPNSYFLGFGGGSPCSSHLDFVDFDEPWCFLTKEMALFPSVSNHHPTYLLVSAKEFLWSLAVTTLRIQVGSLHTGGQNTSVSSPHPSDAAFSGFPPAQVLCSHWTTLFMNRPGLQSRR